MGRRGILWLVAICSAAAGCGSAAPHPDRPIVLGNPHAQVRVIVLHGLYGDPEIMLTRPYARLARMLTRRDQVIIAPEPFDAHPSDQAQGATAYIAKHGSGAYRRLWLRDFRRLTAWASRTYGAKRLVVAGISWGGMHALLAACSDRQVSAFAVASPVVSPNALVEFAGLNVRQLDPALNGCASRLRTMPGFIGWGDADTRVGVAPVEGLLREMPRTRSCPYHRLGHVSNPETLTNLAHALVGGRISGCDRTDPR